MQASSERMIGWNITSGSSPICSLIFFMFALMISVSSQCAMTTRLLFAADWKILINALYLSTSILPVEEPMNSFIPGISFASMLSRTSMLSFVAPGKKAQFTRLFSLANSCFSRKVSKVVVCGLVLGMSKYEVMPP